MPTEQVPMTKVPLSTATVAKLFAAALTISSPPTVSALSEVVQQPTRTAQKASTISTSVGYGRDRTPSIVAPSTSIADIGELRKFGESERQTTSLEKLQGELRSWGLFRADWDGEGAAMPNARSLQVAVSFVGLLDEDSFLPEPMLHATGHAGLFWKDNSLYADIEFLGDGRIAYYIERQGDKHKGVLKFDPQKMPAVFPALLWA